MSMPQAIARSIWALSSRQHLVGVGVLPQVVEVAGEAALARQQRRRMRDRAPAVGGVLGVEREVDADVVGGRYSRRRGAPTGPAP